ncbi:MAG: AsnC family transcriptional regulator [Rhodobacteraceae bacterium]|jgi:DNA-binding Lrp family transcriptional regulator|uniref:siroheme decarboxylase subunit beta n=1 Tax=Albidovulum sp. TaxID=1872424 RepID=UPI001DC663DE|nr:AsnC family transcriptional regulator [uncultured Defluviimonas sp.]MCB2125607.1 AsnC family transcriptional regulator [Paracoccaceae bacterium]MCC0071484.1 AsnC family transcriptional regulator [Paracoccaceae bacterium]
MFDRLDSIDRRLLDEFQRDLPLVPRPFAAIGAALGLDEAEVIDRLSQLKARAMIARVGATVRPNTAGASTLAAMTVPESRIEEVAALVGAEPGVNHSYLREADWNLWFVATAPDAAALEAALARIDAATGLRVLDLRLVRPFNIDLGFRLTGSGAAMPAPRPLSVTALNEADRPVLQALTTGLALVPRPFAALAAVLGRDEAAVIGRVAALSDAGFLTRVGVIVRHRAVGWRANAMVVWALPEARIAAAGAALARHPGITLCYQRRTVPGVWDYPLYSMIHARSRAEALAILDAAAALPELAGVPHRTLFSARCFKQTGALLAAEAA